MADRPVEQLTLREMFTEVERNSREIIDHLQNGFLPKSHSLLKLVRGGDSDLAFKDVEDINVYNSAERLLQSEQFSEQQYSRLSELTSQIDIKVTRIAEET